MKQTISILNNSKLYFKFLSELQQAAGPFQCRISVQKGGITADAKIFREILTLLDGVGPHLVVTAEGEDAQARISQMEFPFEYNKTTFGHINKGFSSCWGT